MDLKEIKKLIKMVEDSEISGLMIEEGDMRVKIQKELTGQAYAAPTPAPVQVAVPAPAASTTPPTPTKRPLKQVQHGRVNCNPSAYGRYFYSVNPDAPAYVKEGDSIAAGQVVCIIEAMKLFNEIESDISGKIEKILVKNGDPVEYGQDLFLVR